MSKENENEEETKQAQKALDACLGRGEFKGLSEQRRTDEFINALCGGGLEKEKLIKE